MERRTGVQGPIVVVLRVLDLVNDSTLWEQEWPDWGPPEALGSWWTARSPTVDGVCDRFGIQATDWQLGEFPLINGNEFDSLVLRLVRGPDPEWIRRWELVLHSTDRGLKLVAQRDGYWRWATFLGFVPSPFEDRVAAILLVQPAGWAQGDQPLRFVIVGISLKAGFPPP